MLVLVVSAGGHVLVHDFWTDDDPMQRTGEMTNFMKNLSMAGGGLIMFAFYSNEALQQADALGWEGSVRCLLCDLQASKVQPVQRVWKDSASNRPAESLRCPRSRASPASLTSASSHTPNHSCDGSSASVRWTCTV